MEQYTAPGNMKIIYKTGKSNTDADALSRLQFHDTVVRSMTRGSRHREVETNRKET